MKDKTRCIKNVMRGFHQRINNSFEPMLKALSWTAYPVSCVRNHGHVFHSLRNMRGL